MSSVSEEILKLRLRILELDKQKEKEENDKTAILSDNFKAIHILSRDKQNDTNNNNINSKSCPLARYYQKPNYVFRSKI